MQIPKVTPVAIGIFITVTCLVAASIYYLYAKPQDPNESVPTVTYAYCVLPAAVLGVLAVFGYDRYACAPNHELLQESFYA